MIRLAEWDRAGADLPAVLGAGTLSETSLGDLDEALKLAEAPDLLKRTIEGERVWEHAAGIASNTCGHGSLAAWITAAVAAR